MKSAASFFLLFIVVFFNFQTTFAQTSNISFPKDITLNSGEVVTIYQPQPESFSGNKITGRSALSIRKTANDEPVFGAVFYEATISTDKDNRVAQVESLKITNAKFPGVEDQSQIDKVISEIEQDVPKWNMVVSIDDLVATIKTENEGKGADQFNNNPPKIFYRDKPTTLVIIDGDPKIQNDKDLNADRVVNSPSLIFKEGNQWNMYNGGVWYKSTSITNGWTPNTNLSAKVKAVNEQVKKQEKDNNGGSDPTETPQTTDILVSTEAAELLQTDGPANYKAIQGTSLLYASNSSNEIFKDINSQKTFVLLSGRWYAAPNIEGPWDYIAADKLPDDFAKIPEGSDKDEVLSSVAGTDAAEEAKIDAQIPQTAKVDRKTATVTVKYDGTPIFNKIEGTSLRLAENANVTVMQDASGNYFALDNGIWFISNNPTGPWQVANDRPKDVDKIPADNAAYNTKYVYIYESTPQYVYVGYTPGYTGCYVYGPTIVYGTGYYYHPWYHTVYYPRPFTWGFGFSYNPWTGWSMNFGYSLGFMHVGFGFGGHHHYGWFGPPMYRPPYRPYYGGGYYGRGGPRVTNVTVNNITINNRRNNIYNNHRGVTTVNYRQRPTTYNARPSDNNRLPGTGNNNPRPGNNNRLPDNNNRQPGNNNRLPTTNPSVQPRPSRENNNVFADRNGNTFQRDNNGNWAQRDNQTKTWKPATRDNPSLNNLNRESQMRDRGTMRTNNFNQVRSQPAPKPAPSRPAPANNNRRR
ncbi:MAG: hypothetical protein JST75_05800 [Bacteroidetes bacterium]|nr:hypothetical protein [Bacteroidota bacterium]